MRRLIFWERDLEHLVDLSLKVEICPDPDCEGSPRKFIVDLHRCPKEAGCLRRMMHRREGL